MKTRDESEYITAYFESKRPLIPLGFWTGIRYYRVSDLEAIYRHPIL